MLKLILLTKLFELEGLDHTTMSLRSARSGIAWVAAVTGLALVLATLYVLHFVFRYVEREGRTTLALASLIGVVLCGLLWLGLCLT